MRRRAHWLGAGLVAGAVLALAASSALADSGTFQGSFTPTSCGPFHAIEVAAGETTIDAVATADVPSNDIVFQLHRPQGTVLTAADSGTSPEEINYSRSDLGPGRTTFASARSLTRSSRSSHRRPTCLCSRRGVRR